MAARRSASEMPGLGGGEHRRPVLRQPERELPAHGLRLGDRLVHALEQDVGAVEQRLAGEGELDPMRRAPQQVAPEQLLEPAHLPAERRLRDVQAVRRPREAELLGDRDEGAQVPQLDRVGSLGKGEDVAARGAAPFGHRPIMRLPPRRAMQGPQDGVARLDFPGPPPAMTMPAMHESPATGNLTAPLDCAGVRRAADLRLRGRGGPIGVRVRWPSSQALGSPPPVVVVLADPSRASAAGPADDALCDELCAGLGALVLRASWATRREDAPDSALERAAGALEWAADHAVELDGDPERLIVAGRARAAAAAGALALRARDRRWPRLEAQVLVLTRPCPAEASAAPSPAPAAAPAAATIVTPQPGSRCSQRLRAEGAEVNELVDARVDPREFPQQPYLSALTESLRGSLA